MKEVTALVEKAKHEKQVRDSVITQYAPFILKTTSEFANRFISPGVDEEYSIGLLAFNEAIDSFDSSRGTSFFAFARLVIRRRLMDYYKRNSKSASEISMQKMEEENPYIEYSVSLDRYKLATEQEHRKMEIEDYSKALQEFAISFNDLVDAAPKKKDARARAVEAARIIVDSPSLLDCLMTNKQLPLADMLHRTRLSRKTLERNRKYIIAIVLILSGEYNYLKSYIQG